MPDIGLLHLDSSVKEQTFNNNQLCFLSKEQYCMIGDTFSLNYQGEIRYYKMMDIWAVPKDFAIKLLWRLCGLNTPDTLKNDLEREDINILFAHIYIQLSWDAVKNMVKS